MFHAENSNGIEVPLDSFAMKKEDMERFLDDSTRKGRTEDTVQKYRRYLKLLYDFLPGDKCIQNDTLAIWREDLAQRGYSASSINAMVSACNMFLAFMNCSKYQTRDRLVMEDTQQPELTRSEYMRLLSAAKVQGDERLYLLVKTLACLGIHLQELKEITVQNVQRGHFETAYQGVHRVVHIPGCLQKELLAYATKRGIAGDPSAQILSNGRGRPFNRCYITEMISRLCETAQVPVAKGNPRCLRKLYQTTWDEIRSNIEALMEQALEMQIEQEQLMVGWDS